MYKAVDFYLERRKTRQYVGRLSKEKANFVFEYNMAYLRSNNPIALGPDLPVSKTKHKALKLFPSFVDRLPSKKNPAYKEYCHSVGVSPLETNPFVLLAKLGKKGPSSFVCEPVEEEKTLSSESLKQFRKNLQLSIREFANLFDVSPSTIYRIENKKTTGKDTLKKINIYLKSPKTVLDKIKQTGGGKLHENKQHLVKKFFESQAVTELYAILNEFTEPDFLKELKPMSVAVPLPKNRIQKEYISKLDKNNLPTALSIISTNFIPDKIQAKETVLEVSKKHPLSFLFSQAIMDHTGRKVTEVSSLKDDLEGHIVQQMSNDISFNQVFIEMGLSHLQKNKALNADTLSEHLFKSPVFLAEHHKIIKAGLKAFFDENYIVSCSVLMPQIESAIRCLISANGGQIYQPAVSSKEKGFELRPLGALIRDKIFTRVFSSHNKNVPHYFQVLLTDKRGWNLRNIICHGHFPSTNFNRNVTVCIIHALLILSLIKKKRTVQI